jgi:hypothetical protein
MNMIEDLNPGGSPRRAHLERRTRCSFLKIRRIKDESGLWLREWADALTPSSFHFQQSSYFYLAPRLRVYRSPRQIWLCWFGYSLHSSALSSQQRATGE